MQYRLRLTTLKTSPQLQYFGTSLHNPRLWRFNRRSVIGGLGIGLFAVFLPMPLRMFPSASLAILCQVNLPIAVSLVWLSNPLTIIPICYTASHLGAWVLGSELQGNAFSFSTVWMLEMLQHTWQPFLIGSFVLSILGGVVGYIGGNLWWRYRVLRHWKQRQQRHAQNRL